MTTRTMFIVSVLVAGLTTVAARAATLFDPTQPSRGGGAVYADLTPRASGLQATRVSAEHKSAVIDGRTVAVGDTVNGAVVADIRPYEVILRKGGREMTMRMLPKLTIKEKR